MSWAEEIEDMEEKVMDTFELEGVYTPFESQGFGISVEINEISAKMGDKEEGIMRFTEYTATVYKYQVNEVNHGDTIEIVGQEYRCEFILSTTSKTYVIQVTKL